MWCIIRSPFGAFCVSKSDDPLKISGTKLLDQCFKSAQKHSGFESYTFYTANGTTDGFDCYFV